MISYPILEENEYHIHSLLFATLLLNISHLPVKAQTNDSFICSCNCPTLSNSTYYHDGFKVVIFLGELLMTKATYFLIFLGYLQDPKIWI